jgi:hypothetical protein
MILIKIKKMLFIICLLLPVYTGLAQNKINTSFEYSQHQIIIRYEFQGDSSLQYNISVVLKRTSNLDFQIKPELLSGDFGTGKYANENRKIIWNLAKQEEENLTGDDYYFEITANEIKKSGGIAWYVYVGSVLLGGGAAATVLLNNKKSGPTVSNTGSTLANPPARPGN